MEKFVLPTYKAPDFEALGLADAPDAKLVEAQQDGVAPAGYHATTMFPEYFRIHGEWQLAQDSRMDCAAVLRGGRLNVVELRNIRRGDAVVVGREENGTEGIYVHTRAFRRRGRAGDEFAFRQGRSRETAYSKDYNSIYRLLKYEKQHGNILWVLGPACTFDADARAAFSALVDEGYVNGLLAGNALATHDLEVGYRGTALGQDVYTQHSVPNGHYNHLDTINEVRRCGSVRAFVEAGHVKDGIMYTCVKKNVPFVLVGSIRDDGPLPDVYGAQGNHHCVHGLYAAHGGHRKHDAQLPRGGRAGAPAVFLFRRYFGICREQAAGQRQPDGEDHCDQRAGFHHTGKARRVQLRQGGLWPGPLRRKHDEICKKAAGRAGVPFAHVRTGRAAVLRVVE